MPQDVELCYVMLTNDSEFQLMFADYFCCLPVFMAVIQLRRCGHVSFVVFLLEFVNLGAIVAYHALRVKSQIWPIIAVPCSYVYRDRTPPECCPSRVSDCTCLSVYR